MTWLELGLAVLATAAIVLIPGIVVAYLLGLRGLPLWALAAPAGVSMIAVASIIAPFVGLQWSFVPVIVTTAVVALIVFVLRLVLRRRWPVVPERSGAKWWVATAAAVLGGVLVAGQVALSIMSPENISQTFDNVFHLNAIQFVLDTANASPLHVGSMTSAPTGGVWYYPSGWHAVGSLVVSATGAAVPVVSNAVTVFFAAIAWPAGILLLTRTLFGPGRAVTLGAAAVAAALPAFPLLLIDYGVLFPYMMGLALVPASIAAVLRLCAIGWGSSKPAWLWVTVVVGTVPGIFVSHPGAFMAFLVFTTVATGCVLARTLVSGASRRVKAWAVAGSVVYAAVLIGAWYGLRPPEAARTWMPTETVGQAIGEVLTVSVYGAPIGIVVAALVAVGVISLVRRRTWAGSFALCALLAVAVLYVAAAALPYLVTRDVLTGSWYNNIPRLAAILPIAWVPLAAYGAATSWQWATVWARREPRRWGTVAVRAGAWVLLLLLVVTTQATTMRQAVAHARTSYAVTPDSPLLSTDERALLMRLPDHVPADAVIAGSPWTGTALAYALTGRRVMMPHTLVDITPDMQTINDELDEAAPGGEVCDALSRENVGFVLDFGDREVHGGAHQFPGFDELRTSPSVELVDSVGNAKLYRVIGCGD